MSLLWNLNTCVGPTCNDGIQNQNEADIDCGGPCPACCKQPFSFDTNWDIYTFRQSNWNESTWFETINFLFSGL